MRPLILLLLFIVFLGCPSPPHNQASTNEDSFREYLDSEFKKIEKSCRSRTNSCFNNKALDIIQFDVCQNYNTFNFKSVNACDRSALNRLDSFKGNQKTYSSRTRSRRSSSRSRSRRSSSSPSSSTPPPTLDTTISGFCDRTNGVKTAILSQLQGAECATITQNHLDQITELVITLNPRPDASAVCRGGYASLKSGDFSGLTKLKKISFGGGTHTGQGCLKTIPEDIFSGLSELEEIFFGFQPLTEADLGAAIFSNLNKLKKITFECFLTGTVSDFKQKHSLNNEVVIEDHNC